MRGLIVISLLSLAHALHHGAAYFNADKPLIIAHRGASGFLPEHTLQAFATAEAMGADFIEPDVLLTKDGHFVVSHDANLELTTDIADRPEFACRGGSRVINGRSEMGWFSDDFTLAEFKTLKARQRYEFRDHSYDNLLPKVSLAEVLEWVLKVNSKRRSAGEKLLGIYVETKYSEYFHEKGFDMEQLLYEQLLRFNLGDSRNATLYCPVILQSFSATSLRRLRELTDLPLVFLMTWDHNVSTEVVAKAVTEAASEFHGTGLPLLSLFSKDIQSNGVLEKAHALDLRVHPYTLKDDSNLFSKPIAEVYPTLLRSGVDGIFAEFPCTMRVWMESLERISTPLSS